MTDQPNRQIRSLVLSVDLVGSKRVCLLTLEASSIQRDRERSRQIVWMTRRMIKAHPTEIGWQGKHPRRPPGTLHTASIA
jgi:hypothetical protein